MAGAFAAAVQAGRSAWRAGPMLERDRAQPSTSVIGTPFWHYTDHTARNSNPS
jgi:thiazole synthase